MSEFLWFMVPLWWGGWLGWYCWPRLASRWRNNSRAGAFCLLATLVGTVSVLALRRYTGL